MREKLQLKKIILAALFVALGILILKFLPMIIWGKGILFDASLHIATACLALYIIWFFVDQNEEWHLPFFVFSALILFVISVQRIIADAHNDIGLLLGLLIAVGSVAIVERKNLKGKVKF